jgi:tRNA pseudouridine32 synthase/23S rRNA pseudouridine746 synthase
MPAATPSFKEFTPALSQLDKIDSALRITIIYYDSSVVVISKPSHLRSVPGHARNNYSIDRDPMQATGPRKRPREEDDLRILSGQQSWVAAIESFREGGSSTEENKKAVKYVSRLAATHSLVASAPRKFKVFCRYIYRNRERVLLQGDDYTDGIAKDMFECIQQRQRSFLPKPTRPEDSALGQLRLIGFRRTDDDLDRGQDLYIVHRLDCETSGVMVFARTQSAAAALSHDWRQRDVIKKSYVAHVHSWPPYQKEGLLTGSVDIPLRPSDERLKWEICSERDDGAKPSKTLWKVISASHEKCPILLEMTPVTGRTHQLRIHCLAVGKGIIGDTLYGVGCLNEEKSEMESAQATGLRLHAFQLAFPHPESGAVVEFAAEPPSWYTQNKA